MTTFVPKKEHLREVLLFLFQWKKKAAVSHRMLKEIYGKHAPSLKTCEYWFRRFKSGDFDTEDKERSGQPKKFGDKELKALLEEDPCKTQKEYAELLGVSQKTISNRLNTALLRQRVVVNNATTATGCSTAKKCKTNIRDNNLAVKKLNTKNDTKLTITSRSTSIARKGERGRGCSEAVISNTHSDPSANCSGMQGAGTKH